MSPELRKRSGWIEPGIRRIVLPRSGQERYRVQLGGRGKGQRRSQLCRTYQEAKALKDDWTLRGLPPVGAPPLSARHDVVATMDDGLRHRKLDLERRGKDSAVIDRIRVFLTGSRKREGQWPEGAALPLGAVTVAVVEEYRNRRAAAGCRPNTIVRELRELRAMLKKFGPDGFVLPAEVFPPEQLIRVRHLADEEYQRVFPYLREKFGEAFAEMSELALLGVLRQADVRLLQRSQVHLRERVLLLPQTKTEPRAVRLSRDAVVILKRALARQPQHEYVFANPRTGQPYSRVHVSRCWRIAAREVGLRDFTFHDLRHHGPTLAVNHGATGEILQALGGWKTAKVVRRYASVLDPTLDKYLDRLRPRPVS